MRVFAGLIATALALAGCASVDVKEWQAGPDALAFDEAASQCRGQRALAPDAKVGEATFALCMSAKGWRKR